MNHIRVHIGASYSGQVNVSFGQPGKDLRSQKSRCHGTIGLLFSNCTPIAHGRGATQVEGMFGCRYTAVPQSPLQRARCACAT